MLMLTMTNDNDTALKFKVTIRILFVFGRMIASIICIRPNTKDPLFSTALLLIMMSVNAVVSVCLLWLLAQLAELIV